jgi:hypothetical protein
VGGQGDDDVKGRLGRRVGDSSGFGRLGADDRYADMYLVWLEMLDKRAMRSPPAELSLLAPARAMDDIFIGHPLFHFDLVARLSDPVCARR